MDDLRKLLAAATPGPWSAEHHYIAGMVEGGRPNGEIIGNMRGSIDRYNTPARMRADAALIVATVNALPALLAYVAHLESLAEARGRAVDAAMKMRATFPSGGWVSDELAASGSDFDAALAAIPEE